MKAIEFLVEADLLTTVIHHNRHIVTACKETYLKAPSAVIRANPKMLTDLQSAGINIDHYEHVYSSSPLPPNMELTESTVQMILNNNDYVQVAHLFSDARIQKELQQRVSAGLLGQHNVQGRNQYFIPSPSQQVSNDDNNDDTDDEVDLGRNGISDIDACDETAPSRLSLHPTVNISPPPVLLPSTDQQPSYFASSREQHPTSGDTTHLVILNEDGRQHEPPKISK